MGHGETVHRKGQRYGVWSVVLVLTGVLAWLGAVRFERADTAAQAAATEVSGIVAGGSGRTIALTPDSSHAGLGIAAGSDITIRLLDEAPPVNSQIVVPVVRLGDGTFRATGPATVGLPLDLVHHKSKHDKPKKCPPGDRDDKKGKDKKDKKKCPRPPSPRDDDDDDGGAG